MLATNMHFAKKSASPAKISTRSLPSNIAGWLTFMADPLKFRPQMQISLNSARKKKQEMQEIRRR